MLLQREHFYVLTFRIKHLSELNVHTV